MNELELKMIEKLGLTEQDFTPEEQPTIQDVVEALNILTTMMLGEDE